jgi:predicted metalloendopeptidase
LNGIGSHCLLNRADETFAQAMTYLYLKSQTDDNIREEVTIISTVYSLEPLHLSSQQLQEVILNIRSTFYETIKRNTWMTNDTKKVALAKVIRLID